MMTRRFPSLRLPSLGIALALIVAGCGVGESTTDPSVESIESQLQSPNDTYTMDDEAIPDAPQLTFGALDETQVTALNKAHALLAGVYHAGHFRARLRDRRGHLHGSTASRHGLRRRRPLRQRPLPRREGDLL